MELHVQYVLALAALAASCVWSTSVQKYSAQRAELLEYAEDEYAEVAANTTAGWVCGGADTEGGFAYFLGVPYAKQPVGELRFKELQDLERQPGCLNVTREGPVCPQRDVFYGSIMHPRGQSEACIHANVYVPLRHMLRQTPRRGRRERPRPHPLPVLVYVHGGGFDFGSGDPDAHGAQYLVKKNVVVITFNYRIGVFGFLSLNSPSVPGNAGLRDMVKLLRWVRENAERFGGDPDDVTIAGQSAGSAAVHLLTLSTAAQGLFKRAILMSGTASRGFFSTSPAYAQLVSDMFLGHLGINGTDPEEAHRKLVELPLKSIMDAHNQIQDATGLQTFTPVVESEHLGVERILDDDPETLQQDRGKDIPLIIGFTNAECETFRPRFDQIDIITRINNLPVLVVPPEVIYSTPPENLPSKIATIHKEYFGGVIDMEKYLKLCSDSFFIYPALKLAETRAANGGAPVFLYRFAYNADYSVYKASRNPKLEYLGAGHSEDLTFVFRPNHALANTHLSAADRNMTTKMTTYFTSFMRHSKPTMNDDWPPVSPVRKACGQYNNIVNYEEAEQCSKYQSVTKFFDSIYEFNDAAR